MEVAPKRRILYVITKASWGGAQRYVYDMALKARDAGYDVRVAAGTPGELVERLDAQGIETVSIGSMKRDIGFKSEIASFISLIRVIRAFRPDVVHANSSKAAGLACLAARLTFVPRIIFTSHGWAFNEQRPSWQKLIIWVLHYSTVLLSHTTLCVSRAVRHDARHMLLAQSRLVVVHIGVEEGTLLSREDARFMLAPHVSFPFWIGTIAELHPTKNIETLILAFSTIAEEMPEAMLMVMGEGQDRVWLEGLIRDYGLEERVRLRGHVSNASAYLPALDIFVLPSRSEALGYVLLEAGLAKLPVVASRVGGIPEIVEDAKTGLLCPPGDVSALQEALRAYLGSPELRTRMGNALHKRVHKDFSMERMVRGTLCHY